MNLATPSSALRPTRRASAQPTPLHEASDMLATWIVETAAGDQLAFRSLYQATCAKLFGTILRLLNDRQESEDILQEVYAKIWRTAASYDAIKGRPMTWLITIARNRAIDRLRARPPQTTVNLEHIVELTDPALPADALIALSQDAQRLTAALAKLAPHHAAVIRSIYLDGMTYQALAATQGVAVGTLKSLVHRGLARMRVDLLKA